MSGSVERIRTLAEERSRLLVALSGGADSSAALLAALDSGLEVSALHVHHGLRPCADDDAAHCVDICQELNVRLEVVRLDGDLLKGGGNTQAAARQARLASFEAHLSRTGALDDTMIITGHRIEDVLESMWMRIGRGSGLTSFIGPHEREEIGPLVFGRPLLFCWRDDIERYVQGAGLTWIDDPTNATDAYHRNRVRQHLEPLFNELPSRGSVERSVRNLLSESAMWREMLRTRLSALGFDQDSVASGRWRGERARLAEEGAQAPLLMREAAQQMGRGYFSGALLDELPRLLAGCEHKLLHGHRVVLELSGERFEMRLSADPRLEKPALTPKPETAVGPRALATVAAATDTVMEARHGGLKLLVAPAGSSGATEGAARVASFSVPAGARLALVTGAASMEVISRHSGRRQRAAERMKRDGWPLNVRNEALALTVNGEVLLLISERGIRRCGAVDGDCGLEYQLIVP